MNSCSTSFMYSPSPLPIDSNHSDRWTFVIISMSAINDINIHCGCVSVYRCVATWIQYHEYLFYTLRVSSTWFFSWYFSFIVFIHGCFSKYASSTSRVSSATGSLHKCANVDVNRWCKGTTRKKKKREMEKWRNVQWSKQFWSHEESRTVMNWRRFRRFRLRTNHIDRIKSVR